MDSIGGFNLFLWISVMEKYKKHYAYHSSVNGMEVGLEKLNYSQEGCNIRLGT
jgi:hypothetical protein